MCQTGQGCESFCQILPFHKYNLILYPFLPNPVIDPSSLYTAMQNQKTTAKYFTSFTWRYFFRDKRNSKVSYQCLAGITWQNVSQNRELKFQTLKLKNILFLFFTQKRVAIHLANYGIFFIQGRTKLYHLYYLLLICQPEHFLDHTMSF